MKTEKLQISGMTCVNCEKKIAKKLSKTSGVQSADVSWNRNTASVTYDPRFINREGLEAVIVATGYGVIADGRPRIETGRAIGILALVLIIYLFLSMHGLTGSASPFPVAEEGMGYGMLFLIGLLTSVHCIAMCGGINLSQCIPSTLNGNVSAKPKKSAVIIPSIYYNLGRVVSYTVVGALVGALGAAITFSGSAKGIVQIIAGVFMVIMGINMLGIFPSLRKFIPHLPERFTSKIESKTSGSKSPIVVGLLNGLMPCGPLQAMQLYALSTGSPFKGALAMFIFSVGTVPLMFALGALSSILTKKFTAKVMTVGAVLVAVLGLMMFTSGWSLSGLPVPQLPAMGQSGAAEQQGEIVIEDGKQIVNSTLSRGYPAITVKVGTPVKWIIDAPAGSITGCNQAMQIPEYDIEYQFKEGENVIEFTPTEEGKFQYSCWMGMQRSTITVVS